MQYFSYLVLSNKMAKINLRKNSKVWQDLAVAAETPADFLRAVMNLRDENTVSLGKKLGTTPANISMALVENHEPSTKMCYSLAVALDIDPYLLNRVCQDYKMKKVIEQNQQ